MPKYHKRREEAIAKRTRTKLGSCIERHTPTQYPPEWYFPKKKLATRNLPENEIKTRKLVSRKLKRPKANKVSRKIVEMAKRFKNVNSNALRGDRKSTCRTAVIRSKKRVSTKKTTSGKRISVKKIKSQRSVSRSKPKKGTKKKAKAKKEKEEKSDSKPDYWEALEAMAERDRRRGQVAGGPSVAEDALDTLQPTDVTTWHHAYREATPIAEPLYPDIRCRSLASNPEVTWPIWDGLSRETEKLAEADPFQRKMDTDSGCSEDEANVNNNKRKARKAKRKKKKQKSRAKGKTARKGKKKAKVVRRKKGAKLSKSSRPSKSSVKQRKVAKKGTKTKRLIMKKLKN